MSDLFDENGKVDRAEAGRRVRSGIAVLIALAVLVGGGWFAAKKGYAMYMDWRQTDDYIGTGVDDVQVTIPAGASLTDMGLVLVKADVVKSTKAFQSAAAKEPKSTTIQAGTYKMKTHLPAAAAVARLVDPTTYKVVKRVLIREGLRITAMVPVLAKGTGLTEDQINAALKDPSKLGLPDWANKNPEGFLFPDSYEVADKPDALATLKAMTAEFNSVMASEDFANRAAALGYTPLQVLTVASIIEAEVNRPEDRPMVARAIYNRLQGKTESGQPMKLQLDSTVIYANGGNGRLTTTDAQRQIDSPYNTYRIDGLPPGPINSPGKQAIEAALNPADGTWIYWVVVNPQTGETKFASTLADHTKNVAQFQAWCQANKGKC
ncbi:MAG TPA: endolytic transglycosylase MltG [Propionibacteriaceae bacterium]|nr:endolytic transglycosylase MltG [Propionibacteriaceae bacterium]